MATIDSIDFYMGLSSAKSGFNIIVEIYEFASYATNPEAGELLASKSIDVSNIPLISGSGPDWVTFTPDSPLEISESSFIGVVLTHSLASAYNLNAVRVYQADVYDSDMGDGYAGTERYWEYDSGWGSYTNKCCAYRVNCTDSTDNSATTPNANYVTMGNITRLGVRSYMDAATDNLPEKPTNPTPSNEASDVNLNATGVTWEDGGNTDSYNIYYGTLSGFLELLEEGVTDTEYTLISSSWPDYDNAYYWRVDAVNEYGVTQGDEWYFTTLVFDPVLPSGMSLDEDGEPTGTPTGQNNMVTIKRLTAIANNRFWYEDI